LGTWRLLETGPGDGAWNMSVDRALLLSREAGTSPPTLRLYRFVPATVTLGRFQDIADVDLGECDRAGVGVVRRPTGGRAVLHDDELTYSVVASVSDGIPRGVAASYRYLCSALVAAHRGLGVPARLTARDRGTRSAACYSHATTADVSVGTSKLSGSAQVWSGDTVLQHGSFVVTRDIDLEVRLLALDEDSARELKTRTITLQDILGEVPSWDRMTQAIVDAFKTGLQIQLEPGCLSEAEARLAFELRSEAGPLLLKESYVTP